MCAVRLFVVLLLVCFVLRPRPTTGQRLDDMYFDTAGLLTKYGYPVERHYVTTDDGYILGMFRVPYSPESPLHDTVKPPVLLVPGMGCSSAHFLVNGPRKSLSYLLADAGYDVWLANTRGTFHSRNHTQLRPQQSKFWKFSFHEMGVYDLPSLIDYVLDYTGQSQLFYIGYSMGTTAFYIMASEKPDYNDKIRAMFSLAPIVFFRNANKHIADFFLPMYEPLKVITELLGSFEIAPKKDHGHSLCVVHSSAVDVCSEIVYFLNGYNRAGINETMLPVYLTHWPAGTSIMLFTHGLQLVKTDRFNQYDYGAMNLFKYGSLDPPDYNLSRITAPTALLYAGKDWLTTDKDVERLYQQLPNPIGKFLVSEYFGHMDFSWNIYAKEAIYDKVIGMMAQY